MTNLQIRILSAIVLGAVVLGLVWLGGVVCRVLAALVAGAMFYEWASMRREPTSTEHHWLSALCLGLALGCLVIGLQARVLFLVAAVAILVSSAHGWARGQGLWNAAGVAYAAISALTLALIRGDGWGGLLLILFLFAVVWATDVFAYFVGRTVGGPKLAPSISPSKTWSGAVGGAVGGLAGGTLFAELTGWSNVWVAAIALALAVIAQFGDLLESFLKRRQGVKDSSQLIPGHGGFLDRVDGLVVAAWALYVIGMLFGSADNPASGLVGG
ncbi:phosphatidate cytidylyltransferase [Mesorhizobium sp. BAC0120]|uniref:phosphatidate cytidylyltransferase n=1 Tax=Mesorhizobium sp. BAC0120 TaxID=3090670 RepID=UPI00298C29DF|nr:phosphatidate cytidylyltransferase [Mesorhizobium sp. BAC0120]MDW6022818.1 phosphatidate cytidylyltransferase [Mesorhizobium sp. BAC0120]